jgi:hypothetical protein
MKDYNIWIDKYNNKIKISDMTTNYIINCMNMIIRSYTPDICTNVFATDWTIKCGDKYLKSFSKELNKRLLRGE